MQPFLETPCLVFSWNKVQCWSKICLVNHKIWRLCKNSFFISLLPWSKSDNPTSFAYEMDVWMQHTQVDLKMNGTKDRNHSNYELFEFYYILAMGPAAVGIFFLKKVLNSTYSPKAVKRARNIRNTMMEGFHTT